MTVLNKIPKTSGIVSLGTCLILSITYVASLYVWNSKHNRDHPSTIKKRFCSVFVVMLISPVFVYLTTPKELLEEVSLWEIIGLKKAGFLAALILPLCLTIILFLGPLSIQLYSGAWRPYLNPGFLFGQISNIMWLRNHVVAPLSEEFTFRACMLPLLLQSFNSKPAIFIQPLFFGVAHFHHLTEKLNAGIDKKAAIIGSCFQFIYTTLFGFYSAYLFAKTGHFIAPFIAHAFCNHMGFPDIQEIFNQEEQKRKIFIGLYILGLISWIILLPVATMPSLYSNTLYWNEL